MRNYSNTAGRPAYLVHGGAPPCVHNICREYVVKPPTGGKYCYKKKKINKAIILKLIGQTAKCQSNLCPRPVRGIPAGTAFWQPSRYCEHEWINDNGLDGKYTRIDGRDELPEVSTRSSSISSHPKCKVIHSTHTTVLTLDLPPRELNPTNQIGGVTFFR